MSKVIGIDLGTTMSVMAIVNEMGQPEIIPNNEGDHITPSDVLIRGEKRIVGKSARNAAKAKPDYVAQFIKRHMSEPEFLFTDGDKKTHRAEEISAAILKKLKQDAEQRLGEEVTKVVITVPAYFGDLERQRTKHAGEIAGFEVLDIINEPTAAAIAYGLDHAEKDMTLLVYDLGGGTFDVTVMRIAQDGELKVITSDGNKYLGGADFDEALKKEFEVKFKVDQGINLEKEGNIRSDQEFREVAEKTKKDLSSMEEVDISLSAVGKVMDLTLTRIDFEQMIAPLIDESIELTKKALKDSEMEWSDLDKILLVGGSTLIPYVRRHIQELTRQEPETSVNPDEVVAMGAAIYAANLGNVIVRNKQGNELLPMKIRNVTAHSLGIIALLGDANKHEINSKIIVKNTEIPAQGESMYSTVEDNQTSVQIQIVQGEDEDPQYCTNIGDAAILSAIPPQPEGEPQIKIVLEYDASGIIHLSAEEIISGQAIKAEIQNPALLSDEALEQSTEKMGLLKVS